MTDIEKTCYPVLVSSFEGPASTDSITTPFDQILETLAYRVKISDVATEGETIKVFGAVVSDAYVYNEELID